MADEIDHRNAFGDLGLEEWFVFSIDDGRGRLVDFGDLSADRGRFYILADELVGVKIECKLLARRVAVGNEEERCVPIADGGMFISGNLIDDCRSEERRVGKE